MADRPASSRSRPESARSTASRQAWGDEPSGGYDNAGASYGEAMEGDNYDPSIQVQQDQVQVQETQNGCWHKFTRGIRCELYFFN